MQPYGGPGCGTTFLNLRSPILSPLRNPAVTVANPKTIVVLFTEGGADVTPWIDQVPAVVQAFHPGSEGGNIIADILYGEVNHSGKLTVTWPKSRSDLPTTGPDTHYEDTINEFGYRYFDKHQKALQFPFGYGLSYTTFDYESLTTKTSTNSLCPVTATVAVKNSGRVAGKEVIQIYVANTHSAVEQPVKKLAGFAKVELKPCESKTVEIPLHWTAFKFFAVKTKTWVLEPGAASNIFRMYSAWVVIAERAHGISWGTYPSTGHSLAQD